MYRFSTKIILSFIKWSVILFHDQFFDIVWSIFEYNDLYPTHLINDKCFINIRHHYWIFFMIKNFIYCFIQWEYSCSIITNKFVSLTISDSLFKYSIYLFLSNSSIIKQYCTHTKKKLNTHFFFLIEMSLMSHSIWLSPFDIWV
jgi:hypothetical protein